MMSLLFIILCSGNTALYIMKYGEVRYSSESSPLFYCFQHRISLVVCCLFVKDESQQDRNEISARFVDRDIAIRSVSQNENTPNSTVKGGA